MPAFIKFSTDLLLKLSQLILSLELISCAPKYVYKKNYQQSDIKIFRLMFFVKVVRDIFSDTFWLPVL